MSFGSHYEGRTANKIQVKLPIGFKYLETPLNALINRLEAQEERIKEMKTQLDRIESALQKIVGEDENVPV